MKKTLGLAVLIIMTVIFAYVYRLQTVAYIDVPVRAVEKGALTGALKDGMSDPEKQAVVGLSGFAAGEPVYRRGNRYYLGVEKSPIDLTWPFYANEGTALYLMSGQTGLIAGDFAVFEAYEGLFISNGTAFNPDMSQADEEEYILASLTGGLYMNVQPMTVSSAGLTTEIKLNSVLYFSPELIRSYAYQEDRLVYREDKVMYGSQVTIGSVTLSYEDFLSYLGMTEGIYDSPLPLGGFLGVDLEEEDASDSRETQAAGQTAGRTGPEPTTGDTEAAGSTDESSGTAAAENGGETDTSALNEKQGGAGNNDSQSGSGGSGDGLGSTGGSGSGSSSGSSGGGSGSGSSSGSAGGGSGSGSSSGSAGSVSGSGNGSGNGSGQGSTGGGNNGGSPADQPSDEYIEPTAGLDQMTMGVYTMGGKLTLTDPQSRVVRVILRLYHNGKQSSRKNMREGGDFSVTNLAPDTVYEIKGEIIFRNESGVRETKPFLEGLEVSTLPISTLDPITLTFGDAAEYLPKKIAIPELLLTGAESVDGGEVLLSQASKIRFVTGSTELFITGTTVRKARSGEAVTWTSEEVFASHSDYPFTLEVQDRFGNVLPLTDGTGGSAVSRTSGTAHTCYLTPTVSLTEESNQVGLQTIGVRLTNTDNVVLNNCYLKVLNSEGDVLPAFSQVGSDPNTMYQRAVNTSTGGLQTMDLTMLSSGISCRVVVTADFDLEDRPEANPRTGQELGRISIYTAPISRLGYAYITLTEETGTTASAFGVTARVNTSRTQQGLLELMTEMPVVITDSTGAEVYRGEGAGGGQIFSKEYLEAIAVGSGAAQLTISSGDTTLKLPRIVMTGLPSDSTNAWEAYTGGAQVTLAFPDGTFQSKTVYTVTAKATARQGGTEYEVGSSVNVLGIQTMRKPAAFTYSEEFSISDFYELYGFCAEDPDGTIPGGTVLLRLYSEGSLVSSQTLNTNVTYEKLRLDRLKQNTTYTIRFYTALYNEGYTSETQELNKLFDTEYTFTTGQGILGSIEMQGVTVNGTYDVDASMNVVLTDQRSELNNGAYRVLIYGAAGIDTSDSRLTLQETLDDNIDTGTAQYTKNFVYNGNKNWKYRADLVVEVRGYQIVLDNTSFTTESNMDTISSWAEMKQKVGNDPAGKYVVISDFEKTDNTAITSISAPFTGSIDFQGHKVTTVNNSAHALLTYIGATGVIENLELDYNWSGTALTAQYSGVVTYNYGTVRNVIVNINWSGKYNHWRAGGIASYNYSTGVIEDFAIHLNNDWYVGYISGGAVYSNAGTIRRGYVASGSSGSVSGIIAGSGVYGGSSGNRQDVGGICGNNSGVIEDVFSLVNVSVETGTNLAYIGGVVGQSTGTVRNSFFVGDIYQFGFNSDKTQTASSLYQVGGGIVGTSTGRLSGLYNFSLEADPNDSSKPAEYGYNTSGTRTKIYAETGELQRLWDSIWYEGVFASPDQFYIEDQVAAGYYPKLKLSDALAASQESISLPAAPAVNAPEYVSNMVDSQTNDTAVLTLYFRNPNAYEITQISINSLTTEIVSQKTEGNFYEVKVKVSNPVKYLSKYNLGYVIYRRTATSTPTTVQYGEVKTAYVAVKFYKGISTVDEWAAMEYDLESNYMLESDINFSTAATDKMVISGTFQGELKGNGYTLKNLKPGSNYAYIFEAASGAVFTNLKVEGLAVTVNDTSSAKASAVQAGFVGSATETDFTDIFLTNVSMTGMPGSAGALVGAATYGSITDCRAEAVSIVTASYTGRPLRTGGLVGLAASTAIKNCYVSGLDLEAAKGVSSQGIGGLIGQVTGSEGVSNCYVQGQIQSSFDRAGGAVGSGQADLSNIWTFVNISCNMPGMGGVLGYAEKSLTVKNSLVTGNMVTSASSGFGRIYGSVASSVVVVTVSDTVAYSGQIAGTGVSGDALGATLLVSGAGLDNQEVYRDDARLGEAFDLEGDSGYAIEDGYMPMLLSSEGMLLTPQTPVMRRDERLSIVDASLTQNQSGGTYTLQIIVGVGESPFIPISAECTAMELGDGTIVYSDETNKRWMLTYPEVTLNQYLSLYQINVLFRNGEDTQSLSCQITGTFSRTIRDANEWVTAMKAYGQDYENFLITGDIDLSEVSQSMLEDGLMNLKINSLKSSGGTHTIKGLTYTTTTNGESMISSLSGSIENLVFEDITINNTGRSGNYIGVIGQNQGTIQNVTFRRITVNGNTGSYLGCVGYNIGTLTGISLEDVSITGSTSSASTYVGGLAGYNTGAVSSIEAVGSSNAGFLTYAGYKARSSTVSSQLPVEQDYSYIVKGYQSVGGIIGYTSVPYEEMTFKSGYVEGNGYIGGVVGYAAAINGTSKNVIVGDDDDQVLPVRVVGKNATGGICGYATSTGSSAIPGYLSYAQIYHSFISGTTYTGGIMGNAAGWYQYCQYSKALRITILATGGSTAGISATGPVRYCEVMDCDIVGTGTIGGITATTTGALNNLAVIDTRITGSGGVIGGIVGNGTIQARPSYVVVTGCEITGTQTSAKVGGMTGSTYKGAQYVVITDTKVSGYSMVGGVAGVTMGGYYYIINCEADVEATSGMAGALAGLVYDFDNYTTQTVDKRQIEVKYVNLGGSVTAPSYCSAFIGRLSYKPAQRDMSGNIITRGNPYLDSYRYNRILLTSSVICTSDAAADQSTASRWAYFSLAGNDTADQISTTDEDYASPTRIDTITYTTEYARSSVWKGVTVADSAGTSIMSAPDSTEYYQWTTATTTQRYGMTLAGYSDMVTAAFWSNRGMGNGNTYGTTAALAASPPRIPYIVYNSAIIYDGEAMLNYQNGTVTGADGQPLATFDIPSGTEVMALSSRSLTVDLNLATAYASGPATLNLELAAGLDGMTLSVSDGTGELLSAVVDKRVYSMPYDFSTPLTVTLSYGDYVYEYQVAAGDVIHTVMNWDGNYYYLTGEGVRSSGGDWEAEEAEQLSAGADDESDTTLKSVKVTQQLLEGQFLHLYKGRALDADGSIWNVKTGKKIKTVDFTNLEWEETTPLQSYNNNGTYLDVYAGFTESADSSSGERTALDSQTFIKDGRLYALDGSLSVKTGAVLADYYSGSRYFTVLGEDGTLHDIETGITLPAGFNNMSIKELADNLDSDAKIAIGRYSNGTVFAFNYLTGTVQELAEDTLYGDNETGLLDYASEWLDSAMGSWFGFNNSSYYSSVSQMNQLSAALGQLSGSTGTTPSPEGTADTQADSADGSSAANSSGQDSAADSEAGGTGTQNGGEDSDTLSQNTDSSESAEDSLNGSISRAVRSILSSVDNDNLRANTSTEENGSESSGGNTAGTESTGSTKTASGSREEAGDTQTGTDDAQKTGEAAAADENQTTADPAADASAEQSIGGPEQSGASGSGAASGDAESSSSEAAASGGEEGAEGNRDTPLSDGSEGSESSESSNPDADTTSAEGSGRPADAGPEGGSGTQAGTAAEGTSNAAGSTASDGGAQNEDTVPAAADPHQQERKVVQMNSRESMVSVYDADSGEYRIYDIDELLSAPRSQLVSVDEKVQQLADQGLITYQTAVNPEKFVEENRHGVMVFAATTAAILLLLLYLADKKRSR